MGYHLLLVLTVLIVKIKFNVDQQNGKVHPFLYFDVSMSCFILDNVPRAGKSSAAEAVAKDKETHRSKKINHCINHLNLLESRINLGKFYMRKQSKFQAI